MFDVAKHRKLAGGVNELIWTKNNQSVTLHLRVISQPGGAAPPAATSAAGTSASGPRRRPQWRQRISRACACPLVAGVDASTNGRRHFTRPAPSSTHGFVAASGAAR